ncbi:MAG: ferrochelatase [Alphaproteobacteria bacterium]
MRKTAVVLFNLGGPDRLGAVQPFLFNLFSDPAIMDMPGPLRWLLAQTISRRRAPIARKIYQELGGGSPLLANTQIQAKALEAALNAGSLTADAGADAGASEFETFIAMRYWHPMSDEAVRAVKAYSPDRVLLLPLYPQFSTTTTGSSVMAWTRAAAAAGLTAPTRSLCCYPTQPGFIAEIAGLLRAALGEVEAGTGPRVLFSAHGLPKKFIDRGDPYQWQIEQTAAAVAAEVGAAKVGKGALDWRVCYQSRVGPLEWIGPSTDVEIIRAGAEGRPLIVVPIAFVSEHSETLVELDIEYRRLAEQNGVPRYTRVATVDAGAAFIEGLAELVRAALAGERACCSQDGGRLCPGDWGRCPQAVD